MDFGVDLRRNDAAVSEKPLDKSNVDSGIKKLGCRRVPQHMRRDSPTNPCPIAQSSKSPSNALRCQSSTGLRSD